MSLIGFILVAALQGLVVGALARLALPGRDPMSIPQTILVGMGGSLIAGLLAFLASGGREGASFFAGFVGAVAIMYFIRRRRGGGLTDPGTASSRSRDTHV